MTKNYLHYLPPRVERGAATLVVAIILLLALTLMTFSAARIGVTEQRGSANDVRAKEALAVAQAGVDQGIAYLTANKFEINSREPTNGWADPSKPCWVPCAGQSTIPCMGRGAAWAGYNAAVCPLVNIIQQPNSLYTLQLDFLAEWNESAGAPRNNSIIYITSTASPSLGAGGDPLAGTARVTQVVKGYSATVRPPVAPLIIQGTATLTGSMRIWGNSKPPGSTDVSGNLIVPATTGFYDSTLPDFLTTYLPGRSAGPYPGGIWLDPRVLNSIPAGTGKPLSVWASGGVDISGSAMTCIPTGPAINFGDAPSLSYEGSSGATCSSGSVGTTVFDGGDILESMPVGTPPPFFPADLFFYMWGETPERVRGQAEVLTSCAGLGTKPSGLYWIDGDCTINSSVGNVGGTGGTAATPTGPIYLIVDGDFRLTGGVHYWGLVFVRRPGNDVSLSGSAVLHGALVSENDLTVSGGSIDLVYDRRALELDRFANGSGGFAKVPGGWFDQPQ